MALTVDEIAEILNTMRVENEHNVENFEKVLTGISAKLELMASDSEATDLIKVYLAELKNLVDDKHNVTSLKFDELNNSLNEIADKQDDLAKTSELRDLFHVFSSTFDNLASDFVAQKAIFDDFNSKLTDLSNKTFEKEELASLIVGITSDLTSIGGDVKKAFTNLQDLLVSLVEKVDNLNMQEQVGLINNNVEALTDLVESVPSKISFDEIIAEIDGLRAQFGSELKDFAFSQKDGIERIAKNLTVLSDSIKVLQDISEHTSQDIFGKISEEIASGQSEISENISSNTKAAFDDLSIALANLISEVNDVKFDLVQKNDTVAENVSTAFASVKLSLENILTAIGALNKNLVNNSDKSAETILANVDELCGKIDELKDVGNTQTDSVAEISLNIADFREHVDEVVANLKEYIAEYNNASEASNLTLNNEYSEKLLGLENALTEASAVYENNLDNLQEKLSEFAQNLETVSSTTEEKVSSSLDEIKEIKQELIDVQDVLNKIQAASDDKYEKVLSLLDAEVKGIINSFDEIEKSTTENVSKSISENVDLIENRFTVLLEAVEKLDSKDGIVGSLEEKFSALKQEIELVNTDILNVVAVAKEDMERMLEPVKTCLEAFSDYDFNRLLAELKTMLETSFMNFSVDVNGELASSSEAIMRLEQAYKETFNKITGIEECVSEKLQNDIELLNVTIETNTKNLQCVFEQKLDEYIEDLKKQFAEIAEDTRAIDAIGNMQDELTLKLDTVIDKQNDFSADISTLSDDLRGEFAAKIDDVLDGQDDIAKQANVISANVTTLGDDLKNYVQAACENTIDKYSPLQNKESIEALHQKIDLLVVASDNEEILNSLEEIEAKADEIGSNITETINSLINKVDIIAKNNSLKEDLAKITDKLEDFDIDNEVLKNAIEVLSSKVDVIAADNSFDALYERFDDFSETENKVAEMLEALHQKVDVIAMDDSDFDIADEIDDIKGLIFEQRKYFEAASDEKANAIDKYLKDVLLKLDSVDLEKNSEDIKETIMNALVSLVDQISFVEETEEIKDFVEEKTDAIAKSLIEVQNQLRQIASSDDDFSYSYTLQDVESDIAKLRMAITNLSGNDFESLSGDIKKIVNSVEGLESTLTQDQIVDLKSDIEKLNDDILSISSRTNKLLLTSDESYKALNDGLNNFSSLVFKLEDRINYFDNSEITERLEKKIENIQSMAVESANADKVFHQVMMYLGEWIDSTTENISSITDKTSEIQQIKESIEELRAAVPEKEELLSELENKFEQQETRIDRLEMKLEKILSTLEEKDDMVLNRKVDKIEKMLSRLGTNIEKLTSYVD